MKIHQMLHGYNQGHNLITSSKKLEIEDMDVIKRLSDWTGHIPNDDEGYLTMYPLPSNSDLYIVAKTWYASEMNRPGCVWTHSLVIDLSDLASEFNFNDLLNYFVRPNGNNFAYYSRVIDYEPKKNEQYNNPYNLQYSDVVFFYGVLCQLFTPTVARIEHSASYYVQLCMSIMQFLPIGFIKQATLCTGVLNERRYENKTFMLQLVEHRGKKISDIPHSDQKTFMNQHGGLSYICNAISQNASDTANSLRLFSQDIQSSTQRLNAVGLFLYALDRAISGKNEIKFSTLFDYIIKSFPHDEDGYFIKSVLCGKNVSNLFDSELNVLTFLATEYELNIDERIIDEYHRRVKSLKKDEYIEYISSLSDADELNSLGKEELINAAHALSSDDLTMLVENHWTVFYSIATLSPSVLYQDFWLNTSSTQFYKIFEIYKSNKSYQFADWYKLYKRLLTERVAIPENIFSCIASNIDNAESLYLDYINNQENCAINRAPDIYTASKFDSVIKWLSTQNKLSPIAVQFIINNFSPITQQVKQTNSRDWEVFAKSNALSFNEFHIFLFQLSHNWSDELALSFLKKSFYAIHTLLANEKLTDSQKSYLVPYFAKVSIWHEWDTCKKLRKGLVKYIHDKNISPSILCKFTPEENLNEMLVRIWNKTYNRKK